LALYSSACFVLERFATLEYEAMPAVRERSPQCASPTPHRLPRCVR